MIKRIVIKSVLPFAIVLSLNAVLWAHRPSGVTTERTIEKSKISHTVVGEFITGKEVFTIKMTLDEDFAAPYEIFVPAVEENKDFRPNYAIFAKGLPEPSLDHLALLPKEVPPKLGLFLEQNSKSERFTYFEEVMRRALWSSGTTALALQKGEVEIWIWSPKGKKGKFQFAFGVEEDFGDGGWTGLWEDFSEFAW